MPSLRAVGQDEPGLLRAVHAGSEQAPSPFRNYDGRRKVSPDVAAKVSEIKDKGHSLKRIASAMGLSKSWVYVVLKRKAG